MSTIREDLKAYLDGELPETRAVEVREALAADPALQNEVNWMKNVGQQIREMASVPAPVGGDRTAAAVRKPPSSRIWLKTALTWALGAACVLIVGAIVFPVFAQSKEAAKRTQALSDAKHKSMMETSAMAPASEMPSRDGVATGDKGGESYAEEAKMVPQMVGTRQVIRNANLGVNVENASEAQNEAQEMAKRMQGFVESSVLDRSNAYRPTASLSLRVPSQKFDQAMTELRSLGDVESENITGQDVTAEITDLTARLKVMRAEEESYITMLRAARKVGELLEIKERLSAVRQNIESIDAQRKNLSDLAALSTIQVTFIQRPGPLEEEKPKPWAQDTWNSAVAGLGGALRFLGQVIITVFVYAPIWLPVAFIGWWASRRLK